MAGLGLGWCGSLAHGTGWAKGQRCAACPPQGVSLADATAGLLSPPPAPQLRCPKPSWPFFLRWAFGVSLSSSAGGVPPRLLTASLQVWWHGAWDHFWGWGRGWPCSRSSCLVAPSFPAPGLCLYFFFPELNLMPFVL